MRHKYATRGIVLSRSSVGEASLFTTVLTSDVGLVRALTQGVRKSGAKLASSLVTFAESELVLVYGKDGWRIAGAVADVNWFARLPHEDARTRAARISHLILRLVGGETHDATLFPVVKEFFDALSTLPRDTHEAAEVLAALRILHALGLLEKDGLPSESVFTTESLRTIADNRSTHIRRINEGIAASGL
jgi:recombinational DNA repair protein (RecF pathway)